MWIKNKAKKDFEYFLALKIEKKDPINNTFRIGNSKNTFLRAPILRADKPLSNEIFMWRKNMDSKRKIIKF